MSDENPIRIRGLDHVVLRVRDLERSLHFYTQVLDAREERRVDRAGLIQLRAGAQLIDLVPLDGPIGRAGGRGPESEGRNVDHFALRLAAFDETRLRTHLEKHGIEPGEVNTRYGADGFGPSMYIQDPDGNVVELKGPPQPR
ncbi:MAG: VOC family protein [Myxococcota bacterium]